VAGEYAIEGVWDLPFATGAAIAIGNQVIWDESEDLFDDHSATPATGDVSVCCISMSTVASTTAGASYPVKINVGIGTVT
jgi:predicted RecA/RadA family phage recombinase